MAQQTLDSTTDHRIEVHLCGTTLFPSCSSFALRRTAEDNKGEFSEDVVKTVKRNFYVGDCLKSVKSVENAVSATRNPLQSSFRLTKWSCNRSEVLDTIPQVKKAPSVVGLDLHKINISDVVEIRERSAQFETQHS